MDIKLEKQSLIRMIEQTNDLVIIQSIKNLFQSEKKDFWDELTEYQKEEINLSLKEFDEGKYSDFEEFVKPHLA